MFQGAGEAVFPITPNGAIWDLQHLLPGDQIIANRGYNVADSVGLYCAEIKILPFTKGKQKSHE